MAAAASDASKTVTIRVKKHLANRLLGRRQMVLEVIHQGRANVSRKELQQKIATMYKAQDPNQVVVYGLRTQFGGGRSAGIALVYDNIAAVKKFEPKYRQVRQGLVTKTSTARKQRKERKNRMKKIRGVKKSKGADAKKGKK